MRAVSCPSLLGCLCLCLLAVLPGQGRPATAASAHALAGLTGVLALGTSGGRAPIYAATEGGGLYRSTTPPFSAWTRRTTQRMIVALSPDPARPDTVLYAAFRGRGMGIYRSTDAGQTTTVVTSSLSLRVVVFARDPHTPSTIYAGGGYGDAPAIYTSTDDGLTWSRVYTVTLGYPEQETVDSITVDSADPAHVIAGVAQYHGGVIVESRDGGSHWHDLPAPPEVMVIAPLAVTIGPTDSRDLWAAWSVMGTGYLEHSRDGGRTWVPVTAGLPHLPTVSAMAVDPLSHRLYVDATGQKNGTGSAPDQPAPTIYASRDGGPFERFAPAAPSAGAAMALLADQGYVVTGDRTHPLWSSPLVGPGLWGAAAPFASYVASVHSTRLLGRPISPSAVCGARACQYFEKGRLEDHGGRSPLAFGALTAELLRVAPALPVGGGASTVTYRTLSSRARPSARIAPPPAFRGGVAAVADGIFIPDSPTLGVAPGHVVPPYFWWAMTDRGLTPGGWLHDLGLPLTNASTATVTKGGVGVRRITVQAFQFAILTYDPRNPPAWRVERANLGTDYARVFPQAVR